MMIAAVTSALSLLLLLAAAFKWELKPKHSIPWSLLIAAIGFAITYLADSNFGTWPSVAIAMACVVGSVVASIGAILFFFFRDPERKSPLDETVLVSPADGTVVYVKEIEDGRFPFAVKNNNRIPLSEFSQENLIPDRGIQIGIAMNYLNVHVNRSPISGTVRMVKPIGGKFLSLKHIHALLENERALMVFENENLKVGIVQIASRLVRRIVPYVKEGQTIKQGDRVGMIKFGSQVDLLIAYRADLSIKVKVGDELVAGESIVMTCQSATPVQSKEPAHSN
ncbi:MAG: phosphatidylserine decarboxylase [Pirellula sp.]|jgi:phosphatidylserine decarboxylase|nr:phosphatidylserine decarboxylase [Pirellula sp.]